MVGKDKKMRHYGSKSKKFRSRNGLCNVIDKTNKLMSYSKPEIPIQNNYHVSLTFFIIIFVDIILIWFLMLWIRLLYP